MPGNSSVLILCLAVGGTYMCVQFVPVCFANVTLVVYTSVERPALSPLADLLAATTPYNFLHDPRGGLTKCHHAGCHDCQSWLYMWCQ